MFYYQYKLTEFYKVVLYKKNTFMIENKFTSEPLCFIIVDKTHVLVSKRYIEAGGTTITLPRFKLEADLSNPKMHFWYPIMARQMVEQLLGLTVVSAAQVGTVDDTPTGIKIFLINAENVASYEKNGFSARILANAHYLLTDKSEKHLLEKLHLYNHHADPPKNRVASKENKKQKV
jgi:hypothetical protein